MSKSVSTLTLLVSLARSQQCVSEWNQCGGFSGDKEWAEECCAGLECDKHNKWYSQCVKPGQSTNTGGQNQNNNNNGQNQNGQNNQQGGGNNQQQSGGFGSKCLLDYRDGPTWSTRAGADGKYRFYSSDSDEPQVLRGISMTGMETGARTTGSGAGYWLYQPQSPITLDKSLTIIRNVVRTLVQDWGANTVRVPICGSAWLQNYNGIDGWSSFPKGTINYKEWVDVAVCEILAQGAVAIIDNHLWAIGDQTVKQKDAGREDGCTGINKVDNQWDSCAPHDWYGEYTSDRTGKSYNAGDQQGVWQCAIANADGVTTDNLKREGKDGVTGKEHFLNLWHDIAEHYKGVSGVFLELFNEPYQRKSADYGREDGFGTNDEDHEYDWAFWTELMGDTIDVVRAAGNDNVIIVSGMDWGYDYYGDGTPENGGPIVRPQELLPWVGVHENISYSLHPYQHGSCCGEIGATEDLSIGDKYQSAFCMYAPKSDDGERLVSGADTPVGEKCNSSGYAETVNKKSPPCIWIPQAQKFGSDEYGVCAGDRDTCEFLNEQECKDAAWDSGMSGGWSRYALPMAQYGPLIATEFGPFDCSSPFTSTFLEYSARFDISYTAWALWPQNSGGPGQGACGYPSVMKPSQGDSDGFGKGANNCLSRDSCAELLEPLPWSGVLIQDDMVTRGTDSYAPAPTPEPTAETPVGTPAPVTLTTPSPVTAGEGCPELAEIKSLKWDVPKKKIKDVELVVGSKLLVDFKGEAAFTPMHQVASKQAFKDCVLEGAEVVATQDAVLEFEKPGTYYYASAGGCQEGQKVAVVVSDCPTPGGDCDDVDIEIGAAKKVSTLGKALKGVASECDCYRRCEGVAGAIGGDYVPKSKKCRCFEKLDSVKWGKGKKYTFVF